MSRGTIKFINKKGASFALKLYISYCYNAVNMTYKKKCWKKNLDYREYMRIQHAVSRHFIYYASQIMKPDERLTAPEIAERLTEYLCPTGKAQITAKTVHTCIRKAQQKAENVPVFLETYQLNPAYLAGEHWESLPPRPGPIRKKYTKKDRLDAPS